MEQIIELISDNIEIYGPIIVLLAIWLLIWKGLALWKSFRQGHYWWFVIF